MSCGFDEDGVAYLDGELPPMRAEAFTAHLPGCGACTAQQAQLAQLRRAVEAAASASPPPLAPGLRARVLSEVAAAQAAAAPGLGAWLRGHLRPWLLAPGLAGLGALAWLAVRTPAPLPPQEAALPAWAAEVTEEPAVLEAALVLDELDELELGALESPDDLEVVSALDELEREGRP
jgi:anti-sigma factor RsiW